MLYKNQTSFHNEFIVNSQQLLIINFIILLLLIIYMFFWRSKSRKGLHLNLKKDKMASDLNLKIENDSFVKKGEFLLVAENIKKIAEKTAEKIPDKPLEKTLETPPETPPAQKGIISQNVKRPQVYFVHNGHEWECHEVLGVKLDDSLAKITEIYQNLIKTSDPSTFEFYESAYTCLLKRKKE